MFMILVSYTSEVYAILMILYIAVNCKLLSLYLHQLGLQQDKRMKESNHFYFKIPDFYSYTLCTVIT